MMKKVILSGANGFIGSQTIPYLVNNDYEVHCVTTKTIISTNKNIIWHKLDLLNENECKDLFRVVRPTHLLHFAWFTEPGIYWSSEKNYDWVNASLKMLYYFNRYGGEKATFSGTCAEYEWKSGIFSEDTTPINPMTVYGICKNQLRLEAESFCSKQDISFSWGRIFFLFGPNEHQSRLVPSVILSLLNNTEAKCTQGAQQRDFLYSEDVASAFVKILDSNITGIVNIGSGKPISIREIVDKIGHKLGRPDLVKFGAIPMPLDDPSLIVADIKRLKNEIGWKSKFSLDNGLDKTIEWWKQNAIINKV